MPSKRDHSKGKSALANRHNTVVIKSKRSCSVGLDLCQRPEAFEENAKLCALVKQHRCIYDGSCVQTKKALDKAWQDIAERCQKTVTYCKDRWRNLRSAYARSIAVYKTQSGPNRVKPYYLHNELKFLNPFIRREEAEAELISKIEPSETTIPIEHAGAVLELEIGAQDSDSDEHSQLTVDGPVSVIATAKRKRSANTENNSNNPKLIKLTPTATVAVVATAATNAQVTENSSPCVDKKFLECVLWDMKDMTKRQKNICKIKICESVHAALDSTGNYYSVHVNAASGSTNPTTANCPASSEIQHSGSETVVQLLERRIGELSKTDLQALQRVMQQRERELEVRDYHATEVGTSSGQSACNEGHEGHAPMQQALLVLPFTLKEEPTSDDCIELSNDSGVSTPTG